MTAPRHGPATEWERQLLDAAGVHLDNQVMEIVKAPLLRALRAGHEAGRASVLDAPARVYRVGDPEPDTAVSLIDQHGYVSTWRPTDHDWLDYLRTYAPLVEVRVAYAAALAADETRRAES